LGIIILGLISEAGPYVYLNKPENKTNVPGYVQLADSMLIPDKTIMAKLDGIVPLLWEAKAEEGAEMGALERGLCSICKADGNVVSIYSKAWPWFTTTWTGPMPMPLKSSELVEGVALCSKCYNSLTFGAKVFSGLTQTLPNWLTREIFSPGASRAGKENARRSNPDSIYGGVYVLPVLDQFLNDDPAKKLFVNSIGRMGLDKKTVGSIGRHLGTVTGFEFLLPDELEEDVHRLTLIYYSGDPTKGDIHLRATVEDVLPSVATTVHGILEDTAEVALELRKAWYPDASSDYYTNRNYRSLPFLLVAAYGTGYLWQCLADVLHKRSLSKGRFIRNVVSREQELSRKLPDSIWQLRDEVLFYEAFRYFIKCYSSEILQQQEGGFAMRPWQELQQALMETPVRELHFNDVEELGFACGHVVRIFSRWYWHRTKVGERGKDFLKDRVMTFGSSLTPDYIWQRALSRFEEYAMKVSPNQDRSLGNEFRQLYGLVLADYSRSRVDINRHRDAFMAAFWAGYALLDAASKSDDAGTGEA